MKNIKVLSSAQRIIVNPQTNAVSVIYSGPPGPPGPPGASGAPVSFVHNQVSASSSWLIDHDLGFYPNVSVQDDLGKDIECGIVHHSLIQIELQFLVPKAGVARLS